MLFYWLFILQNKETINKAITDRGFTDKFDNRINRNTE